jgi:hypothetical protein
LAYNVPLETARDGLRKSGMPDVHADALMELLGAMKANKLDVVADGGSAQATSAADGSRPSKLKPASGQRS